MNGKHSDTWYSCGFCKFTTSHKKSMKRHMVLGKLIKQLELKDRARLGETKEFSPRTVVIYRTAVFCRVGNP